MKRLSIFYFVISFSDTEKLASINKAVESFNNFTCVRYVKLNDDEVDGQDHAHFMINQTM